MDRSACPGKGFHGDYQIQQRCIVCNTISAHVFIRIDAKSYWRCDTCQATFLDSAHRISIEEENAYYCLHRNDTDDPKYRCFLSKLTVPLLRCLPGQAKGLDYGCGPGPALAGMLSEAGHRMSLFDPHFFPDPEPLNDLYDFITCTETIEHFHHPAKEFKRLDSLLRPGGCLAIMTCFQTDDTRFASWHYRRDPTHVVFYREKTLCHIAREFGWTCEIPVKDVALMLK